MNVIQTQDVMFKILVFIACVVVITVLGIFISRGCEKTTEEETSHNYEAKKNDFWELIDKQDIDYAYDCKTYKKELPNGTLYHSITTNYSSVSESMVFVPKP